MDMHPIPGYEGRYSVTDEGVIWSHLRGRALRPRVMPSGHRMVSLHNRGQRSYLVHRLVMLALVGEPDPGQEVCHVDGDPGNNRPENLRYGSRSENVRDQVNHGVHNNARKTHCPKGHEYTPENTGPKAGGGRRCKTCAREWSKRSYHRDDFLFTGG